MTKRREHGVCRLMMWNRHKFNATKLYMQHKCCCSSALTYFHFYKQIWSDYQLLDLWDSGTLFTVTSWEEICFTKLKVYRVKLSILPTDTPTATSCSELARLGSVIDPASRAPHSSPPKAISWAPNWEDCGLKPKNKPIGMSSSPQEWNCTRLWSLLRHSYL